MLLDRAKLGRALCANNVASAEESVTHHFLRAFKPLSAGVLAEFDEVALEIPDFGHQLKRSHSLEVVIPVLHQNVELGKVLLLPIDDGFVVFGSDSGDLAGHWALHSAVSKAIRSLSNERSNFKRIRGSL